MTQEHPLAEILRAFADGKQIEVRRKRLSQHEKIYPWTLYCMESINAINLNPATMEYRIKPKELVKKFRWVYIDSLYPKKFFVTDHHYASDDEYKKKYPWNANVTFIQPVNQTCIEVEE